MELTTLIERLSELAADPQISASAKVYVFPCLRPFSSSDRESSDQFDIEIDDNGNLHIRCYI